jgi:hypothetical protein
LEKKDTVLQVEVVEMKEGLPQPKCWTRLPWVPDYKSPNIMTQILCRRDNFHIWGRFNLADL